MAKITRLSLDQSGLEHRRLNLREITDDSDAPLETVGQDLRKARQRKGEDLAQVSQVLKIRKDHLDALEESNFASLPGRAYVIGFVRSYADYLGLDGRQCVDRLKAEMAGRAEVKLGLVPAPAEREQRIPQSGIVFGVLLAIAIIYGAYYLVVSINRMGSQSVAPVPANLAEQAGLTENPAPPAAATPIAEPPPAPPPQPSVAESQPSVSSPPPLPEGRKFGAQNLNSRITIRAHRPTRAFVQGPNNLLLLDRNLLPGDSYIVPNMPGVVLSSPHGGALEIILDGTSSGFLGTDGVTYERLSIDPKHISERKARG